jgi:phosphonatase-like hydrolase
MSAYTLACFGLIGTTMADDGTLERAYAEAIATQGIVTGTAAYARCMAQVHRSRGKSGMDVLREVFPGNEARAQAAHLAFERSLSGVLLRSGVRPVPGASEALDELAGSGVRVCVISSISHRQLSSFLTALGWQDRVSLMLGADDVPRGCPAPDPILQAMLRLGIDDVRETAVIQSTDSGVRSGRAAGAGLVAAVLTGTHSASRLRQAGATHVLASVADVPAIIAGAAEPGLAAARVTAPREAPEARATAASATAASATAAASRSDDTRAVRPVGPALS